VERCADCGFDLAAGKVEVVPTAHYMMGGVEFAVDGTTERSGLFVAGEDSGGVHGANRLASNSLLEALVFSDRVVRKHFNQTGGDNGLANESLLPSTKAAVSPGTSVLALRAPRRIEIYQPKDVVPITPTATEIRHHMWNHAGLVRDADGLSSLLARSDSWVASFSASSASENLELASLATLARLVATAASYRTESRGAHFRTDYPVSDDRWRRRTLLSAVPIASQQRPSTSRRKSKLSGAELLVLASASSS